MAAKVLFLFVAVLVVFEAEALYRRGFFDPKAPFMQPRMDEEPDKFIFRRAMLVPREDCKDEYLQFCNAWAGHCSQPMYFTSRKNFATFAEEMCKKTCGYC
ncbi:hypothetical protein OS493_001972 [Desmophyllum pertusum]|uniref:ShKT domain-containing protein n=1 Tax=Desmophyllum pertusum TaxID=174260 RepID=A0A9W9Z4P8_9CNID|nr:hypothetical protein OS493_001972 [Desmophyllum pertusum]